VPAPVQKFCALVDDALYAAAAIASRE